jgi:hypothetical protein
MRLNNQQILTSACGFLLLVVLVIILKSCSGGGVDLTTVGTFTGGVLGPILTFTTLMYLIKSNEDSQELNNFDKTLKLIEIYKKYLKNFELELSYEDDDWGKEKGKSPLIGFELLNYASTKAYTFYNKEYEFVFSWVEKYVECVCFLVEKSNDREELMFTLKMQYTDEIEQINNFINSFNDVNVEAGQILRIRIDRIKKLLSKLDKINSKK